MTEPADAPKFTKARRNRTFALGVAAGAVLMLGDTPGIGAQPADVFRQVINQELDQAGIVR